MRYVFILALLLFSSCSRDSYSPMFRALVDEIHDYNAKVYFRDPRVAILIAQHSKGEYEEIFDAIQHLVDDDQTMIQMLKETLREVEAMKYLDAWDKLWRWYPMKQKEVNY